MISYLKRGGFLVLLMSFVLVASMFVTVKDELGQTFFVSEKGIRLAPPPSGGELYLNKTFGDIGNDRFVSAFWDSSNGDYTLYGYTTSFGAGSNDAFLVKLDSSGNSLFSRTYGAGTNDVGMSVLEETNGDIVMLGRFNKSGINVGNISVIKTDLSGNPIWSTNYPSFDADENGEIIKASDGNYVISTTYSRDFYLAKFDSTTGNKLWNFTYGGTGQEISRDVIETSDNGYLMFGDNWSGPANARDVLLVKTDSTGIEQWRRSFDAGSLEVGFALARANDGYALAAYTNASSNNDIWLIKTDLSGNLQWQRTFAYNSNSNDQAFDITTTPDGGYAILGNTDPVSGTGTTMNVWLIKLDSSGNPEFNRTYGASGLDDRGFSIIPKGNEFIIAGFTRSFGAGQEDAWILETGGVVGYPVIQSTYANPNPVEQGKTVNLFVNATDDVTPKAQLNVTINYLGTNYTALYQSLLGLHFTTVTPTTLGTNPYTVYVKDANGNMVSTQGSFQVVQDITAPLILMGPTATPLLPSTVQILWTTDENSDGFVEYGTNYGNYTSNVSSPIPNTAHFFSISPLNQKTVYFYRIRSSDIAGNAVTAENTFVINDTQVPLVTINLPSNGQNVDQNSGLSAIMTASDDTVNGVKRVWVVQNNVLQINATKITSFYFATLNTSTLGQNNITAFVEDYVGNVNQVSSTFNVIPAVNLVISGGSNYEVLGANSVAIRWNTNIPSDSLVKYGTDSTHTTFLGTSANTSPALNHQVIINGLTSNLRYFYNLNSTDTSTGNSAESNGTSPTDQDGYDFIIDTIPPVINGYVASPQPILPGNNITIYVDATDNIYVRETRINHLGTNYTLTYYNSTHPSAINGAGYYVSFPVNQEGLNSFNMYAFDFGQIASGNPGVTTSSGSFNVADVTPPSITNVNDNDPVLQGQLLTVSANIQDDISGISETYVEVDGNTNYTMEIRFPTYSADIDTSSLSVGTHNYKVIAIDSSGNKGEATGFTFQVNNVPDTTPPTIANITNVSNLNSANIQWDTNEQATSLVRYGNAPGSYSFLINTATLVYQHSIDLIGLNPGTTYYYRINSSDSSGNSAETNEQSFTTLSIPDTIPPVISNIASGSINSNSAVITWTTDENANSLVRYGTNSGSYPNVVSDLSNYITGHSLTISGLSASTIYYYKVNSTDFSGNSNQSNEFNFTTSSASTTPPPTGSPLILKGGSPLIFKGDSGDDDEQEEIISPPNDNPPQQPPGQEPPQNDGQLETIDLIEVVSVEKLLSANTNYLVKLIEEASSTLQIASVNEETLTFVIDGQSYILNKGQSQDIFVSGYSLKLKYEGIVDGSAKIILTKSPVIANQFTIRYLILIGLFVIAIGLGALNFVIKKRKVGDSRSVGEVKIKEKSPKRNKEADDIEYMDFSK